MMEDQFYDHQQALIKDQQTLVLKGKRTKRQRPMATTTSSCSSGGEDGGFCDLNLSFGGGGSGDAGCGGDRVTSTTTFSPCNYSGEFIQSKTDEEDMANCLILLAQGRRHHQSSTPGLLTGINDAKTLLPDVYECKTCNRRFHTFQALGGHRASHRKPKLVPSENSLVDKLSSNTSLSLQVSKSKDLYSTNSNKSRVHECLICGAEFSSGQALGGHMRRHRPLPVAGAGASSTTHDDSQEIKKPKLELLGLDLNLPAPEVDHPLGPKFSFASKDQVPVLPTAQLVHCNY